MSIIKSDDEGELIPVRRSKIIDTREEIKTL